MRDTNTDPSDYQPTWNITNWQKCLREYRSPENFETDAEAVPEWVPEWAGGQGKIPTTTPEWTYDDYSLIYYGFLRGEIQPHEAALLTGRPGHQIREILSQHDDIPVIPDCPGWVPEWAQTAEIKGVKPEWDKWEIKALQHYWQLDLLGSTDIATLLERSHEEVLSAANWLALGEKNEKTEQEWCGVKWEFQPNAKCDPKLLDPPTQHMVAEASATRFSLLYERLNKIEESHDTYRAINKELDRIFRLHNRIFDKYLSVKSRKFNQCSPTPTHALQDLEQAGKYAIFECLRRWHPDRKIRFSRGAVCLAINREMIAWLESQRLVALPDKIRAVARKLKAAQDNGTYLEETERLTKESGRRCVGEASKHQNNYAYITTVPIMDAYSEAESEAGGAAAYHSECQDNFETCSQPNNNVDLSEIIFKAISKLNPPEKRAVLAYHGLREDGTHCGLKTLEEIGEQEGVTKERIRQRIAKGKERMKKWFETHQIHSLNDALCTE